MAFKTQNPPNKQQIKIQLDLRIAGSKKKRYLLLVLNTFCLNKSFLGKIPISFFLPSVTKECLPPDKLVSIFSALPGLFQISQVDGEIFFPFQELFVLILPIECMTSMNFNETLCINFLILNFSSAIV